MRMGTIQSGRDTGRTLATADARASIRIPEKGGGPNLNSMFDGTLEVPGR
jgi:hypothetical protein